MSNTTRFQEQAKSAIRFALRQEHENLKESFVKGFEGCDEDYAKDVFADAWSRAKHKGLLKFDDIIDTYSIKEDENETTQIRFVAFGVDKDDFLEVIKKLSGESFEIDFGKTITVDANDNGYNKVVYYAYSKFDIKTVHEMLLAQGYHGDLISFEDGDVYVEVA